MIEHGEQWVDGAIFSVVERFLAHAIALNACLHLMYVWKVRFIIPFIPPQFIFGYCCVVFGIYPSVTCKKHVLRGTSKINGSVFDCRLSLCLVEKTPNKTYYYISMPYRRHTRQLVNVPCYHAISKILFFQYILEFGPSLLVKELPVTSKFRVGEYIHAESLLILSQLLQQL